VVQQGSEAQGVTVLPHWPEDTIVVPSNSVDSSAVLQAVAWRAHIDSEIEEKRDLRLHLAALTEDTQVVAVANANSWPDATVESFGIRTDNLGRVVSVYETPFSQSGDWNNEYTYYFDTLGTTLIFQRRSSFFSGCQEGSARETSVAYLGSGGRLIRRD
jgi:hypothetical protein